MSFDVDIGCTSQRGPRERNEDFGGVQRAAGFEAARGLVAAVADGVSGGGLGLEAAQTTVRGLLADFFATPPTWETTVVFERLISAQNAWLADHNRRRGTGQAALTTLTALALRGQTWTLAHVGDTRAWLVRDLGAQGAELSLLTQDHGLDHPDLRGGLSRAMGLDSHVRIDHSQGDVQLGDVFILTSDGVHGRLKPARITELARSGDTAQQASDALVRTALEAGGRDNATALVIRVRGLDPRGLADELGEVKRLPAPPVLKPGDVLDGHTIDARVADTGAHLVYKARAAADGAAVLIKTIHPSRAADLEERAMLAHEAWLGAQVADAAGRGFVRVHPRDPRASALYTVFDWHAGRTLQERLDTGERPRVAEVVAAAVEIARALGRLHRQGVVHRDIKPANLHLGDDGQWRILDLGAALSGREGASQRELHAGTPSYMNPEQWRDGGHADAGSDLFALGVTLYQWLTGQLPYGEVEPWQTARFRRDPKPVSRLRPDVPIWLDHLVSKAVAPDAGARFETAEEMLLALERGAARPLGAPIGTPLLRRDPQVLWQAALAISLLFNVLLIVWLLFLPR